MKICNYLKVSAVFIISISLSAYRPDNVNENLIEAVKNGNTVFAKTFLSQGADINYRAQYGYTPLMIACKNMQFHTAIFLINSGANIHLRVTEGGEKGYTAIMFVFQVLRKCEGGEADFYSLIKLLLEKGADVESPDANGCTNLMTAASNDKNTIVDLLLKHGANINAAFTGGYFRGRTALHIISDRYIFTQMARILVAYQAKINVRDGAGWTPIMYAAKNGNLGLVQFLVDKGAKIYLRNNNGEGMMQIARRFRKMNVIQYLERIDRR